MNKKELKEKSIEELILERDKTKKALKDIEFKKVVSVVENPIQIRQLRRQIARLNTFIHEKEIEMTIKEISGMER